MGKIKTLLIIWFTAIAGICGLLNAQAAPVVRDQANLLSPQQKTEIRRINHQWAQTRHQPQLWVYTYSHLSTPLAGFDYQDPFNTAGNELGDRVLHRLAQQQLAGKTTDGDHQIAVIQRQQRLQQRISFILVYPDNGWHTVIYPSEDLYHSVSNLNKTFLTWHLPNKVGTAASTMAVFNRYQPFISKHIAKVKTVKTGPTWDRVTFILFLPFLMWGLIKLFRQPIYLETSPYDWFGEDAVWRASDPTYPHWWY
ncbi:MULTISPECIES: hypothetical protein [Levilactobacillus]|uniref:hypothetical protein n=1 Tax=Levilactobacillus TaxID=2767886 RepID=UPI00194DF39D|nr:hypothetical protein [Levilactobacillus sp. 244-2]